MFHHFGIEVSQLDRSIQFYQEWFGFIVEDRIMLAGENIVFLTGEDVRIELVESLEPKKDNSHLHLAFVVENLSQTFGEMKIKGVQVVQDEKKLENGWKHAFILGPDGEWIELIEIDSD